MKRLVLVVLIACDDPKASPPIDASAEAAPAPSASVRAGDGCARAGTLDAVETDPNCVLPKANDDVMKDFGRRLTVPESYYGAARRVLRDKIAAHDIHFTGKSLDLSNHDERDVV